jgi:uncharacterized protein YecE (DUF72 family)
MIKWWIGCSGFYYPEWKGVFYPDKLPKNQWFEFYCKEFNSVELNVTFYRFPKIDYLRSWYDRSPANFKFSVKVPQTVTHYKRFKDIDKEISEFYRVVDAGLKEKLGPVLFQLHPGFRYTQAHLDLVIKSLNSEFLNVIEFRHHSWWNEEVKAALNRSGASFCSLSYPGLPDELIVTSRTIYYRFHGVPVLYQSHYGQEQLEAVATEIKHQELITESYCYFNNTMLGNAIRNAFDFNKLAGDAR